MRFCPKCGTKGEIKHSGLCEECHDEEHELQMKDIIVNVCPDCRKYQLRNRWHTYKKLEYAVISVTKNNLKEKVDKIKVKLPKETSKKMIAEVHLTVKKNLFIVPAKIVFPKCSICDKKGTNYFAGIMQLRNPTKELIAFIKNELEKKQGVFVNKVVELKNGVDLYVTKNQPIIQVGKLVQKRFGAEFKSSSKLFSRDSQSSKELHRVTVLLRMPDIKPGDEVRCGDDVCVVKSIDKNIHLVNKKSGKKMILTHEKFRDLKR